MAFSQLSYSYNRRWDDGSSRLNKKRVIIIIIIVVGTRIITLASSLGVMATTPTHP